ncbi:MAG: hypothetical protein V4723_08650 [Pseudomonadota bacterium]
MRTIQVLPLAVLVMLTGCRDAPVPVAEPPAQPQASAGSAAVSPALIATPAEMAAVKLALDGAGLRLFNTVSGSSRLMAFGLARAELVTALSGILKIRPQREEDVQDCGAHTVSWTNGLTVWFMDDRFAGWSVQPSDKPVLTASGIGLGSTRRELDSAYKIELVPDSTLGTEFTAGYLSGLLASADPAAKIVHLWAGNTCIAR